MFKKKYIPAKRETGQLCSFVHRTQVVFYGGKYFHACVRCFPAILVSVSCMI